MAITPLSWSNMVIMREFLLVKTVQKDGVNKISHFYSSKIYSFHMVYYTWSFNKYINVSIYSVVL